MTASNTSDSISYSIDAGSSLWRRDEVHLVDQGYEFTFSLLSNQITGEVFNYDSSLAVRKKCFIGSFCLPFVTIARTVYSIACSVLFATQSIHRAVKGNSSWKYSLQRSWQSFCDIFRALGLGLEMQGYLLYGVVGDCYHARWRYGQLERLYNRQETANPKTRYYTARCFQPITTRDDNCSKSTIEKFLRKRTELIFLRASGKVTRLDMLCMTCGCRSFEQVKQQRRVLAGMRATVSIYNSVVMIE